MPLQIFRQVVEQAALSISITDEKSNILYANPAFQRTTGYTKSEIIGQNQSLLSYRVTPKIVYETMWAQIKRQRPWNGLLVNKRKDGNRYLADLTISPVVNEQGQTTHYLGMHRDVTEVHRLERQVHNQKTLIESVVDVAQVAIVLLDENDRVVLDNQEYKKLIGDLGKEPVVKLLATVREQMGAAYDDAYKKHKDISAREVCIELPKHTIRWFSCAVSWFEEHDVGADAFYEPMHRHFLLLTIQDISQLKKQQEALRMNSLRALLSEQERIQSLRETLAGAIYQLEGPLNTLSAVVAMLERRSNKSLTDDTSTITGNEISATTLEEAIHNSRQVLETLRACIPTQINEDSQPVNLNEILADVLKLSTSNLLNANIVVDWHSDAASSIIVGQPVQLTNLFKQLIANAIEAINERRGSRRELRIFSLTRNDCKEIYIEDNGPGISEDLRFKVFEPFFTTKGAAKQHLGLGLAMAQDVVTRHGGTIDIDPAYHEGCRVRIQLPCVTGDSHGA